MEHIKKRYEIVIKTITRLKKAINLMDKTTEETYDTFRNSLIQCFEFTIDTFWKFMKLYLQDYKNIAIETASPKEILRIARQANIITDKELEYLIDAVTDRNLTSHTYNEDLAEKIATHIFEYYQTIQAIMDRIKIL